MSERDPSLLIEDIIDSAKKILDYTNNISTALAGLLPYFSATSHDSGRCVTLFSLLCSQQHVRHLKNGSGGHELWWEDRNHRKSFSCMKYKSF